MWPRKFCKEKREIRGEKVGNDSLMEISVLNVCQSFFAYGQPFNQFAVLREGFKQVVSFS